MLAFDGDLHVHYGQAYVFSGAGGDTGEMDSCFRGQSNGLLGAAQTGMLFLITGLHTGHVKFEVEIAADEPRVDEAWEECVEASFTPTDQDVRLINWDRELVCELPLRTHSYRVRYEGRGMDAGREADTVLQGEDPVDSYRLSFWPAPPAPDMVVRQTAESARYWHGWAQAL
jgi:hypothetical protein